MWALHPGSIYYLDIEGPTPRQLTLMWALRPPWSIYNLDAEGPTPCIIQLMSRPNAQRVSSSSRCSSRRRTRGCVGGQSYAARPTMRSDLVPTMSSNRNAQHGALSRNPYFAKDIVLYVLNASSDERSATQCTTRLLPRTLWIVPYSHVAPALSVAARGQVNDVNGPTFRILQLPLDSLTSGLE